MKPSTEQIKNLKGQGYLINRDTDNFSARIITGNGCLTSTQLQQAGEAASLYGDGTIALTSRMTLELPGITYSSIPDFMSFLASKGLETGGTGAKVRPVVCCKGSTCTFGLYDTQALALKIHERFYEGYHSIQLPHKFKIACGGCPNNCVKPDLNDFGIVGQKVPVIDSASCKSCTRCNAQVQCPLSAINKNGVALINRELCNNCGRCIKNCPFGAIAGEEVRFSVYIGGRWGKQVRIGSRLTGLYNETEVLDMVEKAILLFMRDGVQGERFANLVDRLGLETVQTLLENQDLLEQKNSIIQGSR
ncbi:4Fe-4S binding protein [uncultured Sphaerochaeta sp.]|uniref:4Fe-4S binding protein n=1 Tax=uncultured Sphaerochaeta sp. TaxID=886478 RepID=UPI002A0A3AEE|nr:4Fe-4S binding protein [uncultured Sphaerochaeta sp.]